MSCWFFFFFVTLYFIVLIMLLLTGKGRALKCWDAGLDGISPFLLPDWLSILIIILKFSYLLIRDDWRVDFCITVSRYASWSEKKTHCSTFIGVCKWIIFVKKHTLQFPCTSFSWFSVLFLTCFKPVIQFWEWRRWRQECTTRLMADVWCWVAWRQMISFIHHMGCGPLHPVSILCRLSFVFVPYM